MNKIKIIGCGSLLMGDDAVGSIIARKLQEEKLPPHIEVIEAGTPGLNLLHIMEPGEKILIVDAIVSGGEAGTLTIFPHNQLPSPNIMPMSAHQIAIPETIKLGYQLQPELMPREIEIWGIEVKAPVIRKMELSPEIKKRIPEIIDQIRQTYFTPGEDG